MRFARFAAAAVVCLACSAPVRADPYPDGGVTTKDVAEVLHRKGFHAEIGADSNAEHTPIVTSAAAGAKFTIYFYNCGQTAHCESIQFYAGYNHKGVAVETINKWNETNRFGRAYLARDGRFPHLEMDVLADQGFTSESLESYLDLWTMLMGRFQAYIHW